jgi:restriction system protein
MRLQNAVKEWAGVVNAIGTGEQLIIVRRYEPRSRDLFLYPTFNYYNSEKANREGFDAKFQAPFRDSAWSAGKHAMERGQAECLVDISYWVHVDQVINIEDHSVWKKLSKFYIWSPEHVESYAKGSRTGNVLLWILRAHKFAEPIVIGRIAQGGPPDFYKHHEEISTDKSKPVLADAEFDKRVAEILKVCGAQKALTGQK